MLTRSRTFAALNLGLLLAACSSGDGGVVSAPAPEPAPTPSPPPATPVGLKSDQPFATSHIVASEVSGVWPAIDDGQTVPAQELVFRYDRASDRYFITLPGLPEGRMVPVSTNDWDNSYDVIPVDGTPQSAVVTLNRSQAPWGPEGEKLSYTGWGWWSVETDPLTGDGRSIREIGTFAYGIPTTAGDVPVTGSASYVAAIWGGASWTSSGPVPNGGNLLTGTVYLNFDFQNGSLAGSMEPYLSNNGFQEYEGALGTFEFADTVYSTGSTKFSGAFISPGLAQSGGEFVGSFNGPQAAELMAQFSDVPFEADKRLSGWDTNQIDHLVGTLSGIWFGRQEP